MIPTKMSGKKFIIFASIHGILIKKRNMKQIDLINFFKSYFLKKIIKSGGTMNLLGTMVINIAPRVYAGSG